MRWIVLAFIIAKPFTASAATAYLRPTTGFMMQPASQYYHAIYGFAADAGTDSGSFAGRLMYWERPKFRANGFEDQDSGWFALIGSKVTKTKNYGLHAWAGTGRVTGFIKATNDEGIDESGVTSRDYSMPGFAAAIELQADWRSVATSIGHQTLIAYGDKDQRDARVAWPFNFGFLSIGMRF